ncbi:hypothetical protein [Desmospora activa]|uniref:Uncharacterized protein n=1 Tax=Desmospora activa DSM 45169 TaxID=1121389 RepID=A0A2T4Z4L4_9BACL|nr:hypothetical protein [Desmospora activa]PTM56822.1 hypothetical protein C8J48_3147 [Desmospora activa DSM 45169]
MIKAIKPKAFPLVVALLVVMLMAGLYISFLAPKEMELGISVDHAYASVDEMKKDAELIVEGTTLSQETIRYEGVLFTASTIKVEKVLNGELQQEEITVLETGGFDGKNHLTMEHNRVMDTSDRYILFLEKYEGSVVENDAYVITGAYQGRFKVNGDQLEPAEHVSKGLDNIDSKQELLTNIK